MDGGGRGSTLWGMVAPGLRLLLKPCLITSPKVWGEWGRGGAGAWGS